MRVFYKWIVWFLLAPWLASAFEWYLGDYNRVKWASNCDYRGNDIGSEASASQLCGRLCHRAPECTRFTWTPANGGTCWLKNGRGNPFSVENNGLCGYVAVDKLIMNDIVWIIDNDGQVRWAQDCNISGGDIETRQTNDTHCGPACLSRHDCIGFVWSNYRGGTCLLKSRGYPVPTHNVIGTVCGEIIGRKASPGVDSSNGYKRTAERACDDYTRLASTDFRIFNGVPAQRDEYPWMAALGYIKERNKGLVDSNIEFLCGGTVISDYYLLTAAHCTDNSEPKLARLGTPTLTATRRTDMRVESCMEHPNFSFQEHKNDIALVKLKKRITFSGRILPACLSVKRDDLPSYQPLVVTGWGGTGGRLLSNDLKKTVVKTVDMKTCKANYLTQAGNEGRYHIENSQYCAADPDHRSDACRGDSGGPIQMFEGDSPVATVVGVVSFGKGCPSNLPGIYSRVSYYLDWIEDSVW